jgi:hypothetical protein
MQELIVSILLYALVIGIILEHYKAPAAFAGSPQLGTSVPNEATEKSKAKAKKETVALDSLTIRQLRVKAREVKIKYYGRMTRAELLQQIKAAY